MNLYFFSLVMLLRRETPFLRTTRTAWSWGQNGFKGDYDDIENEENQ